MNKHGFGNNYDNQDDSSIGGTLEEAAQNYCKNEQVGFELKMAFIRGAKWQAERMYNRNDMMFFAGYCMGQKLAHPERDGGEIFDEWEANLKHISHDEMD